MPISFGPLGVHREPDSRTIHSIALIPCCPVIPAAEMVLEASFFRLDRAVKAFVPQRRHQWPMVRHRCYFLGWVVFDPRLYLNWLPFSEVGAIVSPRSITVRRPSGTLPPRGPTSTSSSESGATSPGSRDPINPSLNRGTLTGTPVRDNGTYRAMQNVTEGGNVAPFKM